MKAKFHLLASLFFLLTIFLSCKKDDDSGANATLSISPNESIVFSAVATESPIEITVTTNQALWSVESSQLWCKVEKKGTTFTVSAEPNLGETAPTPAVITVKAGSAPNVTINVTQLVAEKKLPETEEKLKAVIQRTWLFPKDSEYISLEFEKDGFYTFIGDFADMPLKSSSKEPKVKYGTYTIDPNLKTIILNGFGTLVLVSATNNELNFELKPTGGALHSYTSSAQVINMAPITDKRLTKLDGGNGENAFTFTYSGDKLTKADVVFRMYWSGWEQNPHTGYSTINLTYTTNKLTIKGKFPVTIEYDGGGGTVQLEECVLEYDLNEQGLATLLTFTAPGVSGKMKLKYN